MLSSFLNLHFLSYNFAYFKFDTFYSESFPVAGHTALSSLLCSEFHYEINSNIENINVYQLLQLCIYGPTVCYQVLILFDRSSGELLRPQVIDFTKTGGRPKPPVYVRRYTGFQGTV